jgi:hypothetical protein
MATSPKLDATPVPVATFASRHFTPAEIAELWGVSVSTVIRIFAEEPGVLRIESESKMRKRSSYATLRIPESVLARVHLRMSRV